MTGLETFISIMAFYAILSYIIGPLVFYYLMERSLSSAGNGFIAGSILSVLLWVMVGSKMVK
jgi:threonine/homoserine/homoserine lactone efflux protein